MNAITKHWKRLSYFFPVLGLLLFLTGCPTGAHVADVEHDPNHFRGKDIAIKGNVSESFSFMGQGAFQVDDGTGKIWVLSQDYGVPGNGKEVVVVGRVVGGISFGTRTFATALQLTERPHY